MTFLRRDSHSDTPPVAVVAIGGNSLITDNKDPSVPRQWDAVRETTRNVADMVEAGWTVVVTHGNGPQVGFILRRNELAAAEVPPHAARPDRSRHAGQHRLHAAADAQQRVSSAQDRPPVHYT